MKVYGPYTRKDGRQHVIIIDGKKRRTVSYPRFLMEEDIGRQLTDDETVHHIDGDFTNNMVWNLEIVSRSEHGEIHANDKPAQMGYFTCPTCNKDFIKEMRTVRGNQKVKGKAGPYCSRRCAGKMHH